MPSNSPSVSRSSGSICRTASHIQGGDVVFLESNTIKQNKTLILSADIRSLGAIDLRHGKGIYGASGILIDGTSIHCYNFTQEPVPTCRAEHGLTICGQTHIVVNVGTEATASVSVTSNGKTFTKGGIPWIGTNGPIEMESIHTEMRQVTLCWDCANYRDALWLFGDSYFTYYEERWPYYIVRDYSSFLLSGFPGAASSDIYPDFRQALTHGTPKIAVWCLGMNDPDSDTGINADWKAFAEQFLADCEERGIRPVLATVPNVPDRIHSRKNEYIRTIGYRYIDFASAVGANDTGSGWYDGMLSADQVHPSATGAQALARKLLQDLPEIKG